MESEIRKSIEKELLIIKNFLKNEFTINQNSNFPINNSKVSFVAEENYIKFELILKDKVSSKKSTFKKLGFDESFEVFSLKQKYIIPKESVFYFKGKSFVESKKIIGRLREVYNSNFPVKKNSYYKAIYKISKDHITTLFSSKSYSCDKTFYGSGLVQINVQDVSYQIYSHNDKNENYIVIENLGETNFKNFKFDIDSIIKILAFITGNWYQKERFIFSTENGVGEELFYESLQDSIITEKEIINPKEFRSFINNSFNNDYKLTSALFPEKSLSNLVNNLKLNQEIERTIDLLIEANGIESPIIRCSIYFVALETIVGIIHKKNKDFFKPIKNINELNNIKNELLLSLKDNKNEVLEQEYEILFKKLNHLNSPANKDIFILAYDFFNIDLPKRLKDVLSSRNKFLHGKTPFKEDSIKDKLPELNLYAHRVHLLVAILILKYSGYKGHIKNRAAYDLVSQEYYSEVKFEEDIGQNDNVYYKI
ncbi:hypothetical protein [uncultured Polaribacter sp.]|uniref:hypothetical protein n=1 Tax=uncultured Polaribacter sp. TaxID=174711 RepID=UPI002618F2C6|nr:hypothetical protein [uncultured Polaribacter sp.]